jgi:GNAT superfamily N-acetyltransferase
MTEIVEVHSTSDVEMFCSLPGPGAETPASIPRHAADTHWMFLRDGVVAARCSLWWSSVPSHGNHRIGVIGHLAGTGGDLKGLLDFASTELAKRACTLAIGPMDGNTWRRYRVLTERGEHPPFFLEPDNPEDWPAQFAEAGFAALAEYYSSRTSDLTTANPRVEAVWRRLSSQGFSIRRLDTERVELELQDLYGLALASFRNNFLYTPLAKEEFLAQYRSVMPLVRPELVLIAQRAGKPAGFLFAVPDLLEVRRGAPPVTFIVKTLAAHPDCGGRGLGSVLLWHVNQAAHKLGYRAAIHALMHQNNQSVRISAREAQVFRRYALYARELKAPV